MINPLPAIFADLRRTRSGVVAAVALIAIALSLGIAVSAQERALRRGSAAAADAFDLLVGAPGSETQLVLTAVYLQPAALPLVDGAVLRRLAADPGVADASPIAFGDFYRGHPVVGTTAAFLSRRGRVRPAEGRMFARLDEVVVGSDVELPIGHRFHPSHGEAHAVEDLDEEAPEHADLTYSVVGRLPPLGTPWDRAILAPVEAVWWLHALPTGHRDDRPPQPPPAAPDFSGVRLGAPWDAEPLGRVPAVVVTPASVGDAYRLRGAYRGAGTMAVFPAEVLVELYARLGDARDLLAAIALATQVLVVGAVLLAVFASLRSAAASLRYCGRWAPRADMSSPPSGCMSA